MVIEATHALNFIPQGQALQYVAREVRVSCDTLFVIAANKSSGYSLPIEERKNFQEFAKAACKTQNPDVIWQIAKVESNFRMRIVHINGKEVRAGKKAEEYLRDGLDKNANVDIGPMQINWRANGSRLHQNPSDFFDGPFSVEFLSRKILRGYVSDCKENWVNCYHSYKLSLGNAYRKKIDISGLQLRRILSRFL